MTDKSAKFKQRDAPMTKARFKAIVADYAARFPDWVLAHGGLAFVRTSGPIQQMIWFQDMRAYYRPTHGISALVLPEAHIRMLPKILDVKHREVEHRWHERKFADTLAAMAQQFRPDIHKPLEIIDVLTLCEAEAATMRDSTNNMAMLAILSAWVGRDAEALGYYERMQHCSSPTLAPIPEWEEAMRIFGRDLASAVGAGRGKALLEEAIAHPPNM
ncbi:hypothetical protein HY29_17150 [Hyphomonas beringensis]|uniref:Uncharacterized protein n=1 Tax=Hyphomonas beringensis TaxID=1280946 RepID=A0A062U9Z0_9PROT|nr:hypothetical protein [Hyphomonas beringensis]KCZ53429.1 hypothetical protein HY29_17150 [Hyphomonas beringensis]